MLTTHEAAALLTERGIRARRGGPVLHTTVKQWADQGHFPGAIAPANRRGEWRIPRTAVDAFVLPALGRRANTQKE